MILRRAFLTYTVSLEYRGRGSEAHRQPTGAILDSYTISTVTGISVNMWYSKDTHCGRNLSKIGCVRNAGYAD